MYYVSLYAYSYRHNCRYINQVLVLVPISSEPITIGNYAEMQISLAIFKEQTCMKALMDR